MDFLKDNFPYVSIFLCKSVDSIPLFLCGGGMCSFELISPNNNPRYTSLFFFFWNSSQFLNYKFYGTLVPPPRFRRKTYRSLQSPYLVGDRKTVIVLCHWERKKET